MRTTKILTLSLPPEMADRVEEIAKEENRTKSELFREAIRKYMEDRRWEKARREIIAKAATLGINTEDDVKKIIDGVRSKIAEEASFGGREYNDEDIQRFLEEDKLDKKTASRIEELLR